MQQAQWTQDNSYLDRQVAVKLITGETLPEGVRFWGKSTVGEEILWFGIPRADEVHKTDVEFHVPVSSIAYIRLEGSDV